jgi:surface-anchored protein
MSAMRFQGVLCVGFSVAAMADGMMPLTGHVDVKSEWNVAAGGWETKVRGDVGPGVSPAGLFFVVTDRPYSGAVEGSGGRVLRSSNSSFNFIGVAAGEPVWVIPKSGNPPNDSEVGFGDLSTFAPYGKYLETEPRVLPQPQTVALPWVRHTYQGMTYLGTGDGKFSLSDRIGSTNVVWVSPENDPADNFLMFGGSHLHLNWWFTAQGVYRLTFSPSAYLGPGKTNPTGGGEAYTLTFAVGPVAHWQASHFSGAQLEQELVAGMMADADGDGLLNLVEYGFGLDPRSGDAAALSSGLGLPVHSLETELGVTYQVLEFPRRRSEGQLAPLEYVAEFTGDLSASEWAVGVDEEVLDFTGDEAVLNELWEKVRVRLAVAPGLERGFGRVRLVLPE